MQKQNGNAALLALTAVFFAVGFVAFLFWGIPQYNVYAKRLSGQAQLEYANLQRQALVAQAQAERDASELRAEAIEIVGAKAQQYPEYRNQEFIGAFAECLQNGCASQIIYVPTEASIPITEAGKR